MNRILVVIAAALLSACCDRATSETGKTIVGQVETIAVDELGLAFQLASTPALDRHRSMPLTSR